MDAYGSFVNCTAAKNRATFGGFLNAEFSPGINRGVDVANSSLSSNYALGFFGKGGAVAVYNGQLWLSNTTFADNFGSTGARSCDRVA